MEIALLKELVEVFGAGTAALVIIAWWGFSWWTKHKSNGSDTVEFEERVKARAAIMTMGSDMAHMQTDIGEIKEDNQEIHKEILEHYKEHAKA